MSSLEKAAGIKIQRGPYSFFVKRLLDLLISLIGIVLFFPIWLTIALLVRVKLGRPIFFTQVRAGKNERPFKMIKFRSMADLRDEKGELLPDTERFTRFGNFLRSTSIDEIPELINVFLGQMSLVGPRPLYTFYLPYYTHEEALRHIVRGGITGLAQINGRNTSEWEDRLGYDIKYVKDVTFLNDLKIVLATVFKVLKREDVGIPSVDEPEGLDIVRSIQRPEIMQEIGSSFSISKKDIGKTDITPYFIKRGGYKVEMWYSTGRSCIREILKTIPDKRKIALVPPFTCESVTDPFFDAGYSVYTYPINKNLNIEYGKMSQIIKDMMPSVLLFHAYFGFDTCKELKNLLLSVVDWKLWTINDQTQSMFIGDCENWTDFCIGSIRKWGPIPDGAFLFANEGEFVQKNKSDSVFVKGEIKALTMKQDYLDGKNVKKDLFLAQFAAGRSYIDRQKITYSMSQESKHVVSIIDWEKNNYIRRKNYQVLLDGLKGFDWISIPVSEVLSTDVPYEMPIYVLKHRSEFQAFLARNRVYATIIWSCPKELEKIISDEEQSIYDEILCLPCDQRYDYNDMRRIVGLVYEFDNIVSHSDR